MLIDKEGKLLGKINLIDFLLIIGVVLLVAVCVKFFLFS